MGHRTQTHCAQGHAFTEENTYWVRRKDRAGVLYRRCRECTLAGNKLWEVYKRRGNSKRALARRGAGDRGAGDLTGNARAVGGAADHP